MQTKIAPHLYTTNEETALDTVPVVTSSPAMRRAFDKRAVVLLMPFEVEGLETPYIYGDAVNVLMRNSKGENMSAPVRIDSLPDFIREYGEYCFLTLKEGGQAAFKKVGFARLTVRKPNQPMYQNKYTRWQMLAKSKEVMQKNAESVAAFVAA